MTRLPILRATLGSQTTKRRLHEGGSGGRSLRSMAITCMLGLCVGKMAQSNNILVRWFVGSSKWQWQKATPFSFDRHAVPRGGGISSRRNPFGGSVGDLDGSGFGNSVVGALDLCVSQASPASVQQSDARDASLSLSGPTLVLTDPPYYANIGYADLSDFISKWIRPALRGVFPHLLATMATPKEKELIATPFRHDGSTEKADQYFRSGF